MPTFIGYGRFTPEAMRGMLQNPEDRTQVVSRLFETCGAKLTSWHFTPGCSDFDWILMAEAPNEESLMNAALVSIGGGASQNIRIIRAISGSEVPRVFQKGSEAARSFTIPGQQQGAKGGQETGQK